MSVKGCAPLTNSHVLTWCAFANNRSNNVPRAFPLNVALGMPNAPIQELFQEWALVVHRNLYLFPSQRMRCEIWESDTSLWM